MKQNKCVVVKIFHFKIGRVSPWTPNVSRMEIVKKNLDT